MLEYLLNFFKVLGYFQGRVGVGKRESENAKMDVGVGKLEMLVSENEHVDVSKRVCRPTRASISGASTPRRFRTSGGFTSSV